MANMKDSESDTRLF